MASGIPVHAERLDKFRAWNPARTRRREIKGDPQPWLTHEYIIDRSKWRRNKVISGRIARPSRRSSRISGRRTLDNAAVESVLSQDVEDLVCLVCNNFPDSGLCGQQCYLTWLRGPARRLNNFVEIRDTGTQMGFGAYVKPGRTIKCDKYIGEYIGELLPHDDDVGGLYVFEMEGVAYIDAELGGNMTRFFNHSCRPNVATWSVMIGGRRAIVFQAKWDITEGQQVTIDYGSDYFFDNNIMCRCDAKARPHWPF
jgi:hypothetical protein